jgi:cation diffusion facilitator CzcD-associated flavoprotein CzcO
MLDVLIVGAGVSGISAACHLQRLCPDKTFAILEGRDNIGGTWDLFRYPGIRSDSDMHTFGFSFKPWTNPKVLADGPSILSYLQEAVDEHQVSDSIQFDRKVISAAWESDETKWTVISRSSSGEEYKHSARVLFMCSGYYDYKEGYLPEFSGIENFKGLVIHPQQWPDDLDYKDKKIAVIGSGATAMTIVPAMSCDAAKVTMIQRSPTYVVSRPGGDRFANLLNKYLPEKLAYRITRWRNIRFQDFVYSRSRTKPEKMKESILKLVRKEMGEDYDVDTHFTPRYNPWDQRLCLVPDSDLFKAIKSGKAEVVTDEIDCIAENQINLKSGATVEADILVTATGLKLQVMGGVEFSMDGEVIDLSDRFFYQGMMFSNIPNLIQTFGYINASWTLRADLNSKFVCDMLKRMDELSATQCVPVLRESEKTMEGQGWITDFEPGYMRRGMHLFPKQGGHAPWHNTQNYLLDKKLLRRGPPDDGVLQFI